PSGGFDVVSTDALVMDSYVMALVPVTPDVPLMNPDVLYVRIPSALALTLAQANSPRAMATLRSLIHPCVICIMILLNTAGKVAMPSAPSNLLRLDLKCGARLGAEMLRTILPVNPAADRPWQRGGRTTRMAALTTPVEARILNATGPGSSRPGVS